MKNRHTPLQHALFRVKQKIKRSAVKVCKEAMFHSPLRSAVVTKYAYNFTPQQLCFLCDCLEKTRHVDGGIAEIGCDAGHTTLFLNGYLNDGNINKTYVAVDTFSGFVAQDVAFEQNHRAKTRILYDAFSVNNKKWFDEATRRNHLSAVTSIQADVNHYDLTSLGPLSFVLLDVDLYRPIKKALPELYQALSPGGLMVVDDCTLDNFYWDGSHQAYLEFMSDMNRPAEIVCGKLGVVRKPAAID